VSAAEQPSPAGSLEERLTGGIDGSEIYALAAEIFPICRSITGSGVRETLAQLGRHIPLRTVEVPTGTPALDWTIPREWTIREAYIADESGRRVLDFRNNSLHVLNYSVPVHERLPLNQLKAHIHTLPAQPSLIPYRTSYYQEQWGFCMADSQLEALPDGIYTAVIDATLADGHLTYGEFFHPGEERDEVLFSAHICHPSLANDNCSGLSLLTHLAARLSQQKTRYSYRFLFAPGTIGSLAWLSRNEHGAAKRVRHGLVLSCVGDSGGPTYKKSRRSDAFIDRAMAHVLNHAGGDGVIVDFSPYGYDERQFCSPGFNLPVGLFQRSRFGAFPEYHTSADNLDFIAPEHLATSYRIIAAAINIIENDRLMLNLLPKGEPQLGRRGLYASLGGDPEAPKKNMAMLWVLNLADGTHSLLDIAERAKLPFATIDAVARTLERHGLLRPADPAVGPQEGSESH
jgi:aminopeptidase-like protein